MIINQVGKYPIYLRAYLELCIYLEPCQQGSTVSMFL